MSYWWSELSWVVIWYFVLWFCTCNFGYLKKYFSIVRQYQETSSHTAISITIFVFVFFYCCLRIIINTYIMLIKSLTIVNTISLKVMLYLDRKLYCQVLIFVVFASKFIFLKVISRIIMQLQAHVICKHFHHKILKMICYIALINF